MGKPFGPLQKGLCIGLVLLFGGLFLARFFSHVTSLDRQRQVLRQLQPAAVARVVLGPQPGYGATVPDSVSIADRPLVEALAAAYQDLTPSGRTGRLPGRWQVRLTWVLRDGRRVPSQLHHNDYADLVFFDPYGSTAEPGLEDFLVSTRIASLLRPYGNQFLPDTAASLAP
jgi:hypothetical protein